MSHRWAGPGLILLLLLAGLALAACGSDSADGDQVSIRQGTPRPSSTSSVAETPSGPRSVSLQRLLGPVTVPTLPGGFASAVPNRNLEDAIRAQIGTKPGVSVVVQNLRDGRSAFVNADRPHQGGGLLQLALLHAAYGRSEAGKLDFTKEVTLKERHVKADNGTLAFLELHEGDKYTLNDALIAMVIVSDGASTEIVYDAVGDIDKVMAALGLDASRFDKPPSSTTAGDMAVLLRAIARPDGVSKDSRQAMLELLLQEGIRDGLVAGIPAGTSVAHKTGALGATHDVGLVWGPKGPYIIAVLSDTPGDWATVSGLSRLVYDYFNA